MSQYIWIALGSGLGGVARFALSDLIAPRFGETFPWGTLVINVSGSFVIGFFATLTEPDGRIMVGTFALCFLAVWLGHICAVWLNTLKSS